MGTPKFAVPSLKELYNSDYEILTVYSQPASKANRGQKLNKSEVEITSEKLSLKLRTPLLLDNDEEYNFLKSIKPDMVIVKSRSQTANWAVYTASQGATKYLKLNDSTILTDSQYYWNDTEPTSSVVTLGDNTDVNYDSGQTYIAYCFANTEGYIKAGEYTGNGDADGTFVYTGFRPAFVLVKATTQTESWQIFDSARDPYNVVEKSLQPDNDYAEGSGSTRYVDFLSNGFKWRATWEGTNRDDYPYIYAAFAKNPFKYATAR